jgi:hypothetical protein
MIRCQRQSSENLEKSRAIGHVSLTENINFNSYEFTTKNRMHYLLQPIINRLVSFNPQKSYYDSQIKILAFQFDIFLIKVPFLPIQAAIQLRAKKPKKK